MSEPARPQNFLADIIEEDLRTGRTGGRVVTRFPPEPNGYLHIGHAKSILLNFGLAKAYGGRTNLRFDDTNPVTEDTEYVESIEADVRWLGGDFGDRVFYASDYFERMYQCAERLIREGKAYVDSQNQDQIREQRGSFDRPGVNSPFRDRPAQESLDLFRRMRKGEFEDGACVLRARIDMAHNNVILRDPLLYRIRHARHHRTGDGWCIYPMYDYAHPLEDAFEGVTHSICTLEFESNRELYDWVLDNLGPWDPRPHQYEFARLALGYTVMSKRKLLQLVNEKRVSGWDDPRMPTVAGMRRRGVTPEALKAFADLIGVAKNNSLVDIGKLEYAIRTDLEVRSPRALAVLDPLPLRIENWPRGKEVELDLPWWPGEPERGGSRKVPFGGEILVEREDFTEAPPRDWRRLAPGREVRLAGAYVVRCEGVERGEAGEVQALRCSYDPSSLSPEHGRKGMGAIHWVHAARSAPATIRLYDRLFEVEQPDALASFLDALNSGSLKEAAGARVEPALKEAPPGSRYQFLRQGYFFADPVESRPGAPVWNRTMTLKDTWSARAAEKVAEPRAPRERRSTPSSPVREPDLGRDQARAQARAADPAVAARFERLGRAHGLPEGEAHLLASEAAVAAYFDGAVAAGAQAASASRWILNELAGASGGAPLDELRLPAASFGRFVRLVDAGRLAPAAAKALLADLLENGGEPEERMRALGLEKVVDRGAVAAAVDRALAAQPREVQRYRAGERKLLGVLLGAAMRESQGAADPALVRQVLLERLGG